MVAFRKAPKTTLLPRIVCVSGISGLFRLKMKGRAEAPPPEGLLQRILVDHAVLHDDLQIGVRVHKDLDVFEGISVYQQSSIGGVLVYLDNASDKRYFVQDVLLTGDFKDGQGNVVTSPNGRSVAGLAPNLFRVRNLPDGSFDAPNMIEGVFPGFPGPMRFDLGGYVFELSRLVTPPAGGDWYTFEGSLLVVLSGKKSGAAPLYRMTVPLFGPVRMFLTP